MTNANDIPHAASQGTQRSRRDAVFGGADAAPVVIFRSPVTDVRAMVGRLKRSGVGYREVELSMASHLDRNASTPYRRTPAGTPCRRCSSQATSSAASRSWLVTR